MGLLYRLIDVLYILIPFTLNITGSSQSSIFNLQLIVDRLSFIVCAKRNQNGFQNTPSAASHSAMLRL